MLLDPLAMLAEETHPHRLGISNAFARTTIDERALVITPFQQQITVARSHASGLRAPMPHATELDPLSQKMPNSVAPCPTRVMVRARGNNISASAGWIWSCCVMHWKRSGRSIIWP